MKIFFILLVILSPSLKALPAPHNEYRNTAPDTALGMVDTLLSALETNDTATQITDDFFYGSEDIIRQIKKASPDGTIFGFLAKHKADILPTDDDGSPLGRVYYMAFRNPPIPEHWFRGDYTVIVKYLGKGRSTGFLECQIKIADHKNHISLTSLSYCEELLLPKWGIR